MGPANCCSKLYFLNVEIDEIYTSNFDSARHKGNEESEVSMYLKPNSNQFINNGMPGFVYHTPKHPFINGGDKNNDTEVPFVSLVFN